MSRHALRSFFLLFALFGASVAHAQFGNVQVLSVSISPEYPRPYETITVTPDSSYIDMSSSVVTVSVNGVPVERGTGVQSVPVTVGGPGAKTVISVSAVTGGQTYTQAITVRPSDVALVVEPVSTTHPFYLGAPLVASEGRMRVIALADLRTSTNTRLNPNSLVYTWKFGDQILQDQSGIGRSILTAVAPVRYRDAQITLTVASPDSAEVAQASTLISPVDPVMLVYQSDPLLGPLFDNALTGSFAMNGSESSFKAVGYYFATLPTFNWTMNSTPQGSDADITVRSSGAGTGQATLGISANDVARLQSAENSLVVQFGSKSANLFGF